MHALQAEHVRKTYGSTVALQDASLTMQHGEILALLGANGSGKTTLIKTLATLLTRDSGRITVLGEDLDGHENAVRHLIGYVGQDTERSAYARLTVEENLMFFGRLRNLRPAFIKAQTAKLATHFEFEANMQKQFGHLSGGQKQTVVIMRALLHDPVIIFLDEPTKGLDPIIARRIRTYLKSFVRQEGKSLLLTSHIMTEVDELADRVALIYKGTIPIADKPAALKASLGPQDIIEIQKRGLPESTTQKIMQQSAVVTHMDQDPEWTSFGISDFFAGTDQILRTLEADDLRLPIRHRHVTLEDAYVHHVGALAEKFEQ